MTVTTDEAVRRGDSFSRRTAGRDRSRALATHRWIATPWLFLAPGLLVILCFIVGPFFSTVQLAFTDSLLLRSGEFVGLANFERLLRDARFGTAMLNSTLYMIVVVPLMVFLPLVLATLVAGAGRFMGFFRTAAYLPVIMSPVIVGLIWTNLLERQGLVNEVFATLSIITEPIPFLTDRWLLLFSAMFVTVWMGLGYYMVIYLAALANIDPSLYDAAAMDGAGRIRTFFSVTVPGVRNTMGLIGILSSVAAFRVFGEVYVLTGGTGGVGGANLTMTMLIQREGTGLQAQTGYAAAISLVMFIVLGALLLLQLVMQQRQARP